MAVVVIWPVLATDASSYRAYTVILQYQLQFSTQSIILLNMPILNARRQQKRTRNASPGPSKRARTSRGTASYPIEVDAIATQITFQSSPYEALLEDASQATEPTRDESSPPLSALDNVGVESVDGTDAATASTNEPLADHAPDDLDSRFADDFDGINWSALPFYAKPLRTLKHKKSWVFQHGYRVALLKDLSRTFWVCRYCHQHNAIGSRHIIEVSKSTTAVLSHLGQARVGHRFNRSGQTAAVALPPGQTSLQFLTRQGTAFNQDVVNNIGNFNVQAFRYAAVKWILANNQPLREFETPAFREIIAYANPEAAEALWVSHRSVSTYVLRLYNCILPQVITSLSQAASKIHISFDGWTTKGGKRGFFGIVAHFTDASGTIRDLPIALPQLAGAHTGQRIGEVVASTLRTFKISSTRLGCFVLDNAAANDRAISCLAGTLDFDAQHHRLRCAPHTLNLVGQMVMQGIDSDAYDNSSNATVDETQYLQDWRSEGPLGVLVDIINYVQTPLQYDLFAQAQRAVYTLPCSARNRTLQLIKPVVTRWNSYFNAFVRAVDLKEAIDYYASAYIDTYNRNLAYAQSRGNRLPEAPRWVKTGGLVATDWAVVTEYIDVLRPLQEATMCLEGRGKAGAFGALYEVFPTFEAILGQYESIAQTYEAVDYNAEDAPEDHLAINVRAAWKKLNEYYNKLDDSPYYYAATSLHPYYKAYFRQSWRDKPDWIARGEAGLQQLWAAFRPSLPPAARPKALGSNSISAQIAAIVNPQTTATGDGVVVDQLELWRRDNEGWSTAQYYSGAPPVYYWKALQSKYPQLSAFAINLMTIPASSCDCERLFSDVGDLLEPRRRNIGANLLSAIQCVKSWRAAGFEPPSAAAIDSLSDDQIALSFSLNDWPQVEAEAEAEAEADTV
jgi:hypothetical protein